MYQKVRAAARDDRKIQIFTNLTGVGNVEVNAFQRLSAVIIQKSIREGFGLVVSEALWKGTPVVAGRAGGIPLQMPAGAGGMLVGSTEECGRALVTLLNDRRTASELANAGRRHVRERFLLPRLLMDELAMRNLPAESRVLPAADRDPVCGMRVTGVEACAEATVGGATYRFCCQACREEFLRNPRHFALPQLRAGV